MAIILRADKGERLTSDEVDANFTYLDSKTSLATGAQLKKEGSSNSQNLTLFDMSGSTLSTGTVMIGWLFIKGVLVAELADMYGNVTGYSSEVFVDEVGEVVVEKDMYGNISFSSSGFNLLSLSADGTILFAAGASVASMTVDINVKFSAKPIVADENIIFSPVLV